MLSALAALALLAPYAQAFAEPPSGTDVPEQAVPPGETTPLPPSEHKGVIEPPDIGDEGIHTDVPNPDAGHPEEVIPPSEVPEQAPESENR